MKTNIELPGEIAEESKKKLDSFYRLLKYDEEFSLFESVKDDIEKAFGCSDFIFKNFLKYPDMLKWAAQFCVSSEDARRTDYDKLLSSMLSDSDDEDVFAKKIRIFRNLESVKIAFGDITGRFDLFDVMMMLSQLADVCIDRTLWFLYEKFSSCYGAPESEDGEKQFPVVLGMGKLGGMELNFSSDVDLIFAYPKDGRTNGESPITNREFFTKLFMQLINMLDTRTQEGFVFRVDMRLRPYGENGPVVMSFDSIEDYYQFQGREWERYALIKARVAAGDQETGADFIGLLKPFVYRKYLDYTTIESLRDMKEKINSEINRKGLANNIKLGKGGIREIEFFGQIFQLIRGGIEPELQRNSICDVLRLLEVKGYITKDVSDSLIGAYIFLRNTEHRLQEFSDSRIHAIPTDTLHLSRLAFSLDFSDVSDFLSLLEEHRKRVHFHFSTLLSSEKRDDDEVEASVEKEWKYLWENLSDYDESFNILKMMGYENPDEIYEILNGLKEEIFSEALSIKGRERLEKLIPLLLSKSSELKTPYITLKRIFRLIKTIIKRTCYISLFLENPDALSQLIRLADASSWIVSLLTKHPLLLDELIDPRTLYAPPDILELEKDLIFRISRFAPEDIEYQMEEARIFKQVNMLRVAAADITNALPVKDISRKLTGIADTILSLVLEISWNHLVSKYGYPVCSINGERCEKGFVVIGYGKLGGEELSYGSDLDMVFLHAGEKGSTSGNNSIDNSAFFSRLGQRVLHFLSSRTTVGILYETDMRLRPSGASGLLVSHIDSFKEYQENNAWTWEHQALVRARPVTGNMLLCQKFNEIRENVIAKERIKEKLADDIITMRERMRDEKMYKGEDYFDLKQGYGGIVDIEFLVQYLVLLYAFSYPEFLKHTSNIKIIGSMKEMGILTFEDAEALTEGYTAYRTAVHRLNLAEKKILVPNSDFIKIREKVIKVWEYFLVRIRSY